MRRAAARRSSATPALRRARAHARRRERRDGARRARTSSGSRASSREAGDRGGRRLLPAQPSRTRCTSAARRRRAASRARRCASRSRRRSCREIREYERTSTTVANAYVQPLRRALSRRDRARLRDGSASRQLLRDAARAAASPRSRRRALPGPPDRIGPGGRRARGGAHFGARDRRARPDLLRHGRHDREALRRSRAGAR